MKFKFNANTILTILSAVIGLVAVICYGVTARDGMTSPGIVYFLIVLAMVLQIGFVVLKNTIGFKRWQDALPFVALVLYIICLPIFLWAREQQISLILNSMETAPITVSWIIAAGGMVAASLIQGVGGFFKD